MHLRLEHFTWQVVPRPKASRCSLEPEDVLDLPLPSGVRGYELVDGRQVPVSPASWQHGHLIVRISYLLSKHFEEHRDGSIVDMGEADVLEGEEVVPGFRIRLSDLFD